MIANDPLGLVGTTLGHKYSVESVVRVEAHAVVYRATQLLVNRAVAVRVFTSLASVAPERRKELYHALIHDASKLNELATIVPAVYPTQDVGTVTTPLGDWVPYVVLEWPHGVTLRQYMSEGAHASHLPRTLPELVPLIEPVAVALAIAHEHGIAHADVTPDHILFGEEDERGERRVMLLDFGVAKLLRSAAPGALVSAQADVHALAVVLCDLLATANGAATLPGVTPRARGLEVSDPVEAVFARALVAPEALRFATVGDLWSALRRSLELPALRSLTATIPPDGLAPPHASTGSRSIRPTAQSFAPPPARPLVRVAMAASGFGLVAAFAAVTFMRARSLVPPAAVAAASPPVAVAPPPPPPATCPEGMIDVPGGKFYMGSDDDLDLEKPAHRVSIGRFCMDRFEVTTADYKACSDRGECKRASRTNEWAGITDGERKAFDPLCNIREADSLGRHPINCVTWEMAQTYCAWQDKRLPTEAEWEFAARGPDGRKYPWGDEEPSALFLNACGKECVAWERKNHVEEGAMFDGDDGWVHTAPVGSFPKGASRYGVEDVVGNVWEWVADWHAPYAADDQVDPHGPKEGEKRVMRGGAWNGAYDAWVRPTFRFGADPANKSYGVGFRCARIP